MKRLALFAFLWLGCGGSDVKLADHYDRPCTGTPPAGGWCAECGPIGGGGPTTGVYFACGSRCVSEQSTCSAAPGCACNSFTIR
jgi:hypothetical protein